jgi:hypothetical protein
MFGYLVRETASHLLHNNLVALHYLRISDPGASACDKSSLPFRKARRVNSPDQPCGIQYATA